jgi:NhaA family Na+:H+ antiporter
MHSPLQGGAAMQRLGASLRFLRSESTGGVALIAASLAALLWSNTAAAPVYRHLLHRAIGWTGFAPSLHFWINDALMAVFFLFVSLEIRREMTIGALSPPARMILPGLAALGGVIVPALIYLALTWHTRGAWRGWAIPTATDIAFSLAVLRTMRAHAPLALRLFLTAIAVIDDLMAIVIIAVFYSSHVMPLMLALGGAIWLGLLTLNQVWQRVTVLAVGVWLWIALYLLGGVAMWVCLLRAGIHPTLAGVALAMVLPGGAGGPAERVERALGGVVALVVLPLFGFANAGLSLGGLVDMQLRNPIVAAIALALFIGKPVGVLSATLAARALRLGRLPAGLSLRHLCGGAALTGIGFTMSLFIGDLAFAEADAVKLGVLSGSIASALAGMAVLRGLPNMAFRAVLK